MNEPIEDAYFKWLGVKVADLHPQVAVYWSVLKELHRTEFAWLVVGDDNRAMDGIELRTYFQNESGLRANDLWLNQGCSVLEMLIALANRCEFQTDTPARDWFWEMVGNMGIMDSVNSQGFDEHAVQDILHIFIWRLYNLDGSDGGIFPLRNSTQDQTRTELWYQFCEYLVDQDRL